MTLNTRIFTHRPRVSLARFTFCWWRHNRLAMTSQWPDNCDANTWQVISNSLDIDFIRGDIHGRSCKKYTIMHGLPWITIFMSQVTWFGKDFHEWRSQEWKPCPYHFKSDKTIIHGKPYKIPFLTRYAMPWTHKSTENKHKKSPLSPRTLFSLLTLWHHHTVDSGSHANAMHWYCDVIFVDCFFTL